MCSAYLFIEKCEKKFVCVPLLLAALINSSAEEKLQILYTLHTG